MTADDRKTNNFNTQAVPLPEDGVIRLLVEIAVHPEDPQKSCLRVSHLSLRPDGVYAVLHGHYPDMTRTTGSAVEAFLPDDVLLALKAQVFVDVGAGPDGLVFCVDAGVQVEEENQENEGLSGLQNPSAWSLGQADPRDGVRPPVFSGDEQD